MEVALIHLNLHKNGSDGQPDFIGTVVVKTNIKTANQCKPGRADLLALSETKFKVQFPHRKFPLDFKTTDGPLVQWMQAIKNPKAEIREGVKKNVALFGIYVLADTIVISKDPDGKQIESVAAVGDSVYIRCNDSKTVELPEPVVLLEAANHYFLHQFCIFTDNEFRAIIKNNYGTPWTTANEALDSVKNSIEGTKRKATRKPPIKADDILKCTRKNSRITTGPLVHYGTKLPSGLIKFLRTQSEKTHIPVARILIDCILSKYGDQ